MPKKQATDKQPNSNNGKTAVAEFKPMRKRAEQEEITPLSEFSVDALIAMNEFDYDSELEKALDEESAYRVEALHIAASHSSVFAVYQNFDVLKVMVVRTKKADYSTEFQNFDASSHEAYGRTATVTEITFSAGKRLARRVGFGNFGYTNKGNAFGYPSGNPSDIVKNQIRQALKVHCNFQNTGGLGFNALTHNAALKAKAKRLSTPQVDSRTAFIES